MLGQPCSWPAVAPNIEEQLKFRAWWDAHVRDAGQPSKELAEDAVNTLPRDEAEKLTGMKRLTIAALQNGVCRTLFRLSQFTDLIAEIC
jgi:hypothetical protein